MTSNLRIILSNKLELLYEELKSSLFSSEDSPFTRRLIVVYGPAMKSWLTLRMAQDKELGIAAGMEFIYLNDAFSALPRLFFPQFSFVFPSLSQLCFLIEKEILLLISLFFSSKLEKEWLPLLDYLEINSINEKRITKKIEKRIHALSRELALLFQEYGRYAHSMLEEWELSVEIGWQQKLWKKIWGDHFSHLYPAKALKMTEKAIPAFFSQKISVHFFSISFIPSSEFSFLEQLSRSHPVYYYLLSPCALFWSDIRSDKEIAYLTAFWRKKWKKESPQLDTLDLLLRDRNPLLANFGRLGREMMNLIEKSSSMPLSCYQLPASVLDLHKEGEHFQDVYLTGGSTPLTLLNALQSDLLFMRNPVEEAPFSIEQDSDSIVIHSASNARREVEILYHQILRFFEKNPALTPSDVIVMSPQIKEYVPFIHAIFGGKESVLSYQILDLGIEGQSSIVQGFISLLELSQGRWEVSKFMKLFFHKDFRRRFQFSESDEEKMDQWIQEVGIRWGESAEHRNEILKRRHCLQGMVEKTEIGTWGYGFQLLIEKLIVESSKETSIEFSHSDLLNRWIQLLYGLRDDLSPFHDGTQMKIEDWVHYFYCLLDTYFLVDSSDERAVDNDQALRFIFEKLRSAGFYCRKSLFSFSSIYTELLSLLDHKGVVYKEHALQSIRFCSLLPLRSIPAKVICMLGMQSGAFPRVHVPSSFNLMTQQEEVDYVPSSGDYDRYLFLEILHSAREHFVVTYQNYSREESKELEPCIVLQELLSYLERFYLLKGEPVLGHIVHHHPFDSFDGRYFLKEKRIYNYSKADFRSASLLQKTKKKEPHSFLKDFSIPKISQEIFSFNQLNIKDLSQLAKYPIKFHLNKVLGIYLEKPEDRKKKEREHLLLEPLQRFQIRQEMLKTPLDVLIKEAEKEGKLPFGLFKEVAVRKIRQDFSEMNLKLQEHSIDPSSVFTLEFSPAVQAPLQTDSNHWIFPSPKISYSLNETLYITGHVKHATPKGLLILGKDQLMDSWKAWPSFLLFSYAASLLPGMWSASLLSLEGSKIKNVFFENPIIHLENLVRYYQIALHSFSPLLPEWISCIYQKDRDGLQKKIENLFSPFVFGYSNPELLWILNQKLLPSAENILEDWYPWVELVGGEMIQAWHPPKKTIEVP